MRSRRTWVVAVLGLLLLAACNQPLMAPSPAVPDDEADIAPQVHQVGLLELDGDATNVITTPGDDWDDVYGGSDSSVVDIFIAEGDDDGSYYGTGAKDDLDITSWNYTSSDIAPDKNEIMDAFAAAYIVPDGGAGDPIAANAGDLVVYFGADRFASNGDAAVGFWFFQREITLGPPDTKGDGAFLGEHEIGDILVISHFTNGGTVDTVFVYEWDPTSTDPDLVNGVLVPLFVGADCDTVSSGDLSCANISVGGETSPWPFTPKQGTTGVFPDGAFFEGGINITQLIGGVDVGCFATFLAETRSSQSVDAELKDFALGNFELCDLQVDKTGPGLSKAGDTATYTVEITNNGVITLYKEDITDSLIGDITVDGVDQANPVVTANTCAASLAPDETCTITYEYTLTAAPDPTPNTVTVTYDSEAGLVGDEVTELSDHHVNLFQPSVAITKTADTELSKPGDSVTYSFTITNTSSEDSPNLLLDSVSDTVLGDLTAAATTAGCDDLRAERTGEDPLPAESCTFDVEHVVPADAPDPLANTATATYHPAGFENVVAASDDHSIDLFAPSITFDKTGDTLSKIGDSVDYVLTLTNTSTVDTPDLECTITDALLGIDENVTLASGADHVINASRAVAAGDDDPLPNTANVTCSPIGFPNELTASDDHELELFQPSVMVDKSGGELSKVGDDVTYTFEITNTSSSDSPSLILDSISDTVLGDLSTNATTAGCDTLAPGASCSFDVTRTVLGTDADPLPNSVTVSYHPDGFPNDVSASDDHTVELFQAAIDVDKTGDTLSKVGDDVNYTITLSNNSSADTPDLECTATDSLLGVVFDDVLPVGDTVLDLSRTVASTDPDPLTNSVSMDCSPVGFPNVLTASDDHETELLQASITFDKSGDTLSKIGDSVDYVLTLTNTSTVDTPDLECTITDTLLGIDQNVTLASGADHVINVSRDVQAGDDDPLPNTANVTCSPIGFPNELTASDDHEVELFQPAITFDKSGDSLSKIGDSVDYVLTLTNTSSNDTPDLECTITDTLLGIDQNVTLASGADHVINASRTATETDSDPLVNTASVSCSPTGWPNVLTASDTHSVDMFQPAVSITKTAAELSKVGDDVTYTFEITNDSSNDSPNLILDSISDTVLGDLATAAGTAGCNSLAPGASCSFDVTRTTQQGDADPLPNEVTVHYHPDGFPNDISASDDHSVNLFQPSITVDKVADNAFSKVGDTIGYTVTITNTSTSDTPTLEAVGAAFSDTLAGSVAVPAACLALDPTESCTVSYTYTVQNGDPSTLVNTFTAAYSPTGFSNQIAEDDSVTVTLVEPSFAVTNECITPLVSQDGSATFRSTVENTGDVPLVVTGDNGFGTTTISAGGTHSVDYTVSGPFTGQQSVTNTFNASWVLPASYDLPNTASQSSTAECDVAAEVEVVKRTNGAIDPTYDWDFAVYDGPNFGTGSGFLGSPLATASTLGDADGTLEFGLDLDPEETYTICELATNAVAGWTSDWTVNGGSVSVYNPESFDTPAEDTGVRCVDFGALTSLGLTGGDTLTFDVNNVVPQGDARTPGYWKNWSSCSNGNQFDKATGANDPENEFWTLDEALVALSDPSFFLGDLDLSATLSPADTCEEAAHILDHEEVDGRGRKRANDAAYKLARSLLAYELNQAAGAYSCTTAATAASEGHSLLDSIGFDGTGQYLRPRNSLYQEAVDLAGILDAYNNNTLACSP